MSALYLVARMRGQRVAVRAEQVESVARVAGIRPVPKVAPAIAGLLALRSRVLTVIDTHILFGGAPDTKCCVEARPALVASVDGHPYALLVDGIEDAIESRTAPIPLPVVPTAAWRPFVEESVDLGGEVLPLTDIATLIAGVMPELA